MTGINSRSLDISVIYIVVIHVAGESSYLQSSTARYLIAKTDLKTSLKACVSSGSHSETTHDLVSVGGMVYATDKLSKLNISTSHLLPRRATSEELVHGSVCGHNNLSRLFSAFSDGVLSWPFVRAFQDLTFLSI